MWWSWRRARQELEHAQDVQATVRRRGQEREPLIKRAEAELDRNQFGERWTRALGGDTP